MKNKINVFHLFNKDNVVTLRNIDSFNYFYVYILFVYLLFY